VNARDRRRRRATPPRWILAALAGLIVFAVGIALGQALEDSPRSGHTTTLDRTFTVRPESATVTVTTP
jgi:hypothetical protein